MMKTVLETRKKIGWPILATAIIFAAYHIFIQTTLGDDVYFREVQNVMPIADLMHMRYEQWSSRLVIEAAIYFFVAHPLFWKAANILIWISIVPVLCKLLKADKNICEYCTFLILLYPFYDMVSAGWIATTLNCLWPLWCILYVSLLVQKKMQNRNLKPYEYITGYAALLFGSNEEQAAAALLALLLTACAVKWLHREFTQPFLYIGILLNLLSLAFIFTCPGNDSRFIQECAKYAPDFAHLSVIDKAGLAIINTERVFIANTDIIFLVTAVVFSILIYKKTKNYRKTLTSLVPIGIMFGYTVLNTAFPKSEKLFCTPGKEFGIEWTNIKTYIWLAFVLAVIASILLSVWWLAHSRREFACLSGILGVGYATTVIMGFSPTLYASADRVFIYFYFSLIFVSGYCMNKTLKYAKFTDVEKKLWITVAALLTVFSVINNIPYCLAR